MKPIKKRAAKQRVSRSGKTLDYLIKKLERTKSIDKRVLISAEIARITSDRVKRGKKKLTRISHEKFFVEWLENEISKQEKIENKKPSSKFIRRKQHEEKYNGKHPHVYDIKFSTKIKTLTDLDNIISNINPPVMTLPTFGGIQRTQVKITIISWEPGKYYTSKKGIKKKLRKAVTYIYNDLQDPFDINLAILDILYEIYLSPNRGQKGYLQKVRLGNVDQIVVDFETSV